MISNLEEPNEQEGWQPARRVTPCAIGRERVVTKSIFTTKQSSVFAVTAILNSISYPGAEESPSPGADARTFPGRQRSWVRSRHKGKLGRSSCWGESLTEAGPWRELTGCSSIANRGISGDKTERVLSRLHAM
jgi:hypothetical protein